jgi:hypothetical protein
MKYSGIKIVVVLVVMAALQACQQNKAYEISNHSNEDMIDLALVVNRLVVNNYLADTSKSELVLVRDENGELLTSQCDDIDGDGKWDELAFLCDLEAGENKRLFFEVADTQPVFPVRTNVRFGRMVKPFEEVVGDVRMKTNDTRFSAPVYQMEGPAWENELIAFRNYYDARNGIDIFGKKTSAMVMDSVGVNGRVYHVMADWGMDILKVGNSLGAGAIAIGIGDSLYRVGPCEEGRFRLITEGPVRAILELTYKNVPAGDRLYNVAHRISIYAGDRFYRSKVWISDLRGDEELVTGIVNMHEVPADTLTEGPTSIMFALGNQGYSGEVLGLGLLFPTGGFKRYWEAPATGSGIVSTHLVSLALNKEAPSEYCFMAVWEEQDPRVKEKAYFRNLLQSAAKKLSME